MASSGKLDVEVEVKSNADKFWTGLRDSTIIFPKEFPHDYKSIDVIEGDGKAIGSVRLFTYADGSPIVKKSTEKIEAVDEGNRSATYSVIDGDLLKYYKSFKGHLNITHKGDGSLAKWTCEFEKASDEVPDPHVIKDFVARNFVELDAYLLAAA